MSALGLAVAAWAGLAAGFSLVALWRLRRRPAAVARAQWPRVVLLRPVDAPGDAELSALAEPLDYPGEVDHVLLSPGYPQLPPGVRWEPSDPVTQNRKVGHLLYGASAVERRGAVLVSADGDVRVDGALLKALVAPVAAGADLAWAPPQPEDPRRLAGRAVRGLLGRSHHAFDALQAMGAGAPALCGKALAFGPRALALLPGVSDHVGEDLELSSRLWAAGGRVEVAAAFARVLADRGPLTEALDRFTRWMLVLRAHRPALYPWVPALLAPTPLLLAAAALSLAPAALAAVGLLLAARAALSLRLAHRAGAGLEAAAWEWLLGEALLVTAFLRSLARRTVSWRGRRFALERGGRMRELLQPVAPWGGA